MAVDGAPTVSAFRAGAVTETVDVRVNTCTGPAVWEGGLALVVGRAFVRSGPTHTRSGLQQLHTGLVFGAIVVSKTMALRDADALGVMADGS